MSGRGLPLSYAARQAREEKTNSFVEAAYKDDAKTMETLLNKDAALMNESSNGYTALMATAKSGSTKACRLLLARNCDTQIKCTSEDTADCDKTALELAVWGDSEHVANLLEKALMRQAMLVSMSR
jgi:ankyrin repeat protein